MVPMNLLGDKEVWLISSTPVRWSNKAIKSEKFGAANVAASSEDRNFSYIPDPASWNLSRDAAYLHYTPNGNHWWRQNTCAERR